MGAGLEAEEFMYNCCIEHISVLLFAWWVYFEKLKQNCLIICIPNFVGFGRMFFQTVNEGGYVANRQVLMLYCDNVIDQCIEKNRECSLNELKDILNK